MNRAIILDRDGTLIDFHRDVELGAVVSAFHPSQLRLLPGVIEGLRMFRDAGYLLAIATNQPGAAKGQIPREAITRTNDALAAMLAERGAPIARVATCLHHPEGGEGGDLSLVGPCACRKPAPGLILDLVAALDLDPARTWMVGDTTSDVDAARRAGVRAALLHDPRRCELCPLKDTGPCASTLDGVASAAGGLSARASPLATASRLDDLARAILLESAE